LPAPRDPLLAWADRFGRFIENLLLVVFLFGLIGLASTQIVLRNAFSVGISWADGVVRLAVLWLALLGAVAASRDGRNISINLAGRYMPQRLRRPVDALVDLFTAAAACAFAWYSWAFVADSREYGDLLLDGAPAWIFQLIMPVAFALVAYRYLLRFVGHVRGRL
jgi:TRAP-type C4-dicarboxylate transport system permease small subunit